MLYAWGAWLIFFCLREKIPQYIEDHTLKGTTMNLMDRASIITLRYTNWCLRNYLKVQDKFFPAK